MKTLKQHDELLVKPYIDAEVETRAKLGAHNFLIFDKSEVIARNTSGTWSSNVYTINGGTITLSDIGEIVVNGTFTAQTDFAFTKRTTSELILTPGDYKLVGGISNNISVSGNSTRNGAYYNLGADTGSGLPFTITSDDAGVGIFVRVLAGAYDNVKVSPMITAPNDLASVFAPYAKTNRELTEENQTLTNEVDGGWYKGRNLFNPTTVSEGYIRDTNGELGVAPNSTATDFIPVTSGEKYVITSEQSGSKWGAWYNAGKQYISGFIGFGNLVAPSNAAYMRVTLNYSGNNPNWATTTQIEQGESATPYVPYAKTNQDLTNNLSDEVETRAKLGAHNFFTTENTFRGDGGVWAVENNGVRITNTESKTYSVVRFYQNLAPNTDYILTFNVDVTSGDARVLIKGDDTVIKLDEHPASNNTYTFNSGNYNELFVALYCTKGTAKIGSVLYDNILLRLATDSDPTYQPYAMTNRELTESVNGLKMKHIIKQITLTANDTTILDLSNDFALPSGSVIRSLQLALAFSSSIDSALIPLPYCKLTTGDVQTWMERFTPNGSNIKIINLTSEWTNYYLHAIAFYT